MKKLNKFNKMKFLLIILSLVVWASCKVDKISEVAEPVKDISGNWQVIKATRNGTDLFALLDSNYYSFNKFRITFNAGAYTLVNPLPFIVNQNGTYSLDNPQYPFVITFKQTGSTTPVSTAFTYPAVNGARQLTLVFSPGCSNNTYSYTLQKVN
jgi:hypothetical protein